MDSFRSYLTQTLVGVAQYLTPVMKESKFHLTGTLTPKEFVTAGDHLIHLCPTWRWERGDVSKVKDYLPSGKQFIAIKNVPCSTRVADVLNTFEDVTIFDGDDVDDDSKWLLAQHHSKTNTVDCTLIDLKNGVHSSNQPIYDDDDDDAMDMGDFINSGMIDDDSEVRIVRTRTYDLHITYDKYYQTPRVWLYGYSETRHPLTVDETFEDISLEHARSSVTMETHPHMSTDLHVASIHPCRHAQMMKNFIEMAADGGNEFGVKSYLLIFLKFIQSAIPTIEYDFTESFVINHYSRSQ